MYDLSKCGVAFGLSIYLSVYLSNHLTYDIISSHFMLCQFRSNIILSYLSIQSIFPASACIYIYIHLQMEIGMSLSPFAIKQSLPNHLKNEWQVVSDTQAHPLKVTEDMAM